MCIIHNDDCRELLLLCFNCQGDRASYFKSGKYVIVGCPKYDLWLQHRLSLLKLVPQYKNLKAPHVSYHRIVVISPNHSNNSRIVTTTNFCLDVFDPLFDCVVFLMLFLCVTTINSVACHQRVLTFDWRTDATLWCFHGTAVWRLSKNHPLSLNTWTILTVAIEWLFHPFI